MGRVAWLVMALLVPGVGSAQSLTLRWQAPAGCPDEAAVLRAVRAAGAPERPRQSLVVEAVVTHPGRWRAVLSTRHGDRPGTRTLEARACPRLAQGVAMVIALAMDEAPLPEAPAATPTAPTPVIFVDDDELPPVLRPRPRPVIVPPRSRLHLGLSAHLRVDLGTLPTATPAMGLGVSLGGETLSLLWEASVLVPQEGPGPRQGTALWMGAWRSGLLGCATWGQRLRLGLCTGVELSRWEGRAEGFVTNSSDISWRLGVPLRAVAGVRLGTRVQVLAEAEAMVPTERVAYAVDGAGVLHTVSAVALRMGLRTIVSLP